MRMMKRSPNSGRFAEKKRFFVLAALLLLMTAGSLLYITVFGGTYTDHILYTAEQNPVPESLSVTVDNAEVVAAERAYIGADGNICVDFRSLREGSATATVDYTAQPDGTTEGFTAYIRLYVNSFGTIVQKDDLNFDGYIIVEFVILAGLLLVFIFTLVTFIECFRKARFSYYMVACGGVALFAAFTIVLALYDMQWYNTFRFFLMNLSDSGFVFAVLTTPLMLVLSAAIAGSNIWLLRHEGRRPQNMLGIGLGLLWVLGIAAVIGSSVYYFGYSDNGVVLSTQISYSIAYVLSYMECMLLSTIVSAFLATKYKPPFDKDYLIVLGCGIRKDGTLTPILKGRVDAAIRFERAQFAANGKHAKFVPSGGQGSDEVIQNICFSREKIMADAADPETVRAGVATTNYHIFRAYILAAKYRLDAQGITAKTKWYFYPNAFLREFAGLLYAKKWFILASVLLLALCGMLSMTVLTYTYFAF